MQLNTDALLDRMALMIWHHSEHSYVNRRIQDSNRLVNERAYHCLCTMFPHAWHGVVSLALAGGGSGLQLFDWIRIILATEHSELWHFLSSTSFVHSASRPPFPYTLEQWSTIGL